MKPITAYTSSKYIDEGFFDNVETPEAKQERKIILWRQEQEAIVKHMKSKKFIEEETAKLPSNLKKFNGLREFYKENHIIMQNTTPQVIALYLYECLLKGYKKYMEHIYPGITRGYGESLNDNGKYITSYYAAAVPCSLDKSMYIFTATTRTRVSLVRDSYRNYLDNPLYSNMKQYEDWYAISPLSNTGKDKTDEIIKTLEWLGIEYKIVYTGKYAEQQRKSAKVIVVKPFV